SEKSGVLAIAPARIPMQCPITCCRGLAPSMYPGLMSMSRLLALLATSVVMHAVIRVVGAWLGLSAPKVSCVILDIDPDGVMLVSAVALAAISVSTIMSG